MKTIIYKYIDPDGALAAIKNNSVVLKTPLEYNDPFDCYFSVLKQEEKEAFKLFVNFQLFKGLYECLVKKNKKVSNMKHLAEIYKIEVLKTAAEIKANKLFSNQTYLIPYRAAAYKYLGKKKSVLFFEFKQMLKRVFKEARSSIIISCFGSNNDSILMWSHYANKHKGACLEFEIDDENFQKVDYKEKIVKFKLCDALKVVFGHEFLGKEVDGDNKKYSFIINPLLTKSLDWRYEEEIRCIYSAKKRDPRIYEFLDKEKKTILLLKMPRIKKIYLGCNADEEFVYNIKEVSGDIPVIKMKMKENDYGVEPE